MYGGVMACQAGKDVYVEKPMAHNIWEGQKMIEAARKYKRVVQVGMQSRSAPYVTEAANFIRSGGLGEVHLLRVLNMMRPPGHEAGAGPGAARGARLRYVVRTGGKASL